MLLYRQIAKLYNFGDLVAKPQQQQNHQIEGIGGLLLWFGTVVDVVLL